MTNYIKILSTGAALFLSCNAARAIRQLPNLRSSATLAVPCETAQEHKDAAKYYQMQPD